jgi:WD40 repeat protein
MAYARLAKENTVPVRILEGQKTRITRTMHSMEYDPVNDELVVNSPLAQAILTFKGGSGGEEPPVRVIQGPKTQIQGTDYDGNDKMAFDSVNGEIYIGVATSGGPGKGVVLVFDRAANGDVAPKRMLGGPNTQFQFPTAKGQGFPHMAVDPVRNLLIVGSRGGALLIFDRTASGDAKPKAVIAGPKTLLGAGGQGGLVKVYPPSGMIVSSCSDGSICAWSIEDTGDVAPRFKIPVQKITGINFSGPTLNPAYKEVIVTSSARNIIATFYWPEIFDAKP